MMREVRRGGWYAVRWCGDVSKFKLLKVTEEGALMRKAWSTEVKLIDVSRIISEWPQ